MQIGVLQVKLHIPESGSLKAKRQVVAGILQQVRNRFAVGAAEVGEGDRWQLAELGFVCVSNDRQQADRVLATVLRYLEDQTVGGMLADVRTQVLTVR